MKIPKESQITVLRRSWWSDPFKELQMLANLVLVTGWELVPGVQEQKADFQIPDASRKTKQ